jgi:hypothetical protein
MTMMAGEDKCQESYLDDEGSNEEGKGSRGDGDRDEGVW